jgi:hypothetical protein
LTSISSSESIFASATVLSTARRPLTLFSKRFSASGLAESRITP